MISTEERRQRKDRERDRWIRFSLIPMLSIILVIFVAGTVAVSAIIILQRQAKANAMVLEEIRRSIVLVEKAEQQSIRFHCAVATLLYTRNAGPAVTKLLTIACPQVPNLNP